MSYRKEILKELLEFFKSHPIDVVEASGTKVFIRCPLAKRGALTTEINQLMQEGLLIGTVSSQASGQQKVAIKINPARVEDVKREIGIDWKWWVVLVLGVITALIALLAWIKPFAPT